MGFGAIKYDDGSVYTGELFFDGEHYHKLGFGRQDFLLSNFGVYSSKIKGRKAFYIGQFDYRKTDWIYGNGVLYYVDKNNKPAFFIKGFFEGLEKTGEYIGKFDETSLVEGYTLDMESNISERDILFEEEKRSHEKIERLNSLFIGDSYFEFWNYSSFADKLFYETFDKKYNLNLGLGGTRFIDWPQFIEKIPSFKEPKMIFLNLGFNDIHSRFSLDEVYEHFKIVYNKLKNKFSYSEIVVLNVVHAPAFKDIFFKIEEQWNTKLEEIKDEFSITVLDISHVISDNENKGLMLFSPDQIHLNHEGYALFRSVILNFLNKKTHA